MLRYLLMLSLLSWTIPLFATIPPVVGNIEDLACPSKYYSLTRQNETFPVKILMDLHTGDKLTLTEDKSLLSDCKEKITPETKVLSVNLNGKPNQTIKYSELPYTVPAGPTITTTSDNLLSQLSFWLTEQNDSQLKRLAGLHGKAGGDERPRIAVLEGNQQQLVAGERELFVAWQFGTPPFTVKIHGNVEERTLSNLGQSQFQPLLKLKLVPGTYSLSVKDARQQAVEYRFAVVPTLPFVALPKKLSDSMNNDELTRLIVQALCLTTQDKGIWRFEAIQQITPHVEKYALVRILREALLQDTKIGILDLSAKDCNN